jgi:hypothetical protein
VRTWNRLHNVIGFSGETRVSITWRTLQTGKRRSLRTTDRRQAERLRDVENQAVEQPMLNLALARRNRQASDSVQAPESKMFKESAFPYLGPH